MIFKVFKKDESFFKSDFFHDVIVGVVFDGE
jgi:hypothetical protein